MQAEFDPEVIYRRSFPLEPDWTADEALLYERSRAAIDRFVTDNPSEFCSFFAFDSEPDYGYVLIAMDTARNALAKARDLDSSHVQSRYIHLAGEDAWKSSDYFCGEVHESFAYANSTGWFAYPDLDDVQFSHWQAFAESSSYPGADEQLQTDYLRGHVTLIFWRVIERLVADGAFTNLSLWSPFRLGFNYHDEKLITLRILNWPTS
jgi:hypothetical protein